jgi:hypothetical protein
VDAVRERGFNLDYVLVGAAGLIVPGFLLRRHGATEQDRLACRAIGRRIWLPADEEMGAMRFAQAFWDVMRLAFLLLLAAPLIVLGIIDHTLLGAGPIHVFLAVAGGGLFLSAVEYFITYLRRIRLADTESWVDAEGNQHYLRLRTPKPYDSLLSIGTGLFTAVMMLGLT